MSDPENSKLSAVYARLPDLNCKGLCQNSCGPIGIWQEERERIEEKIGRKIGCVGDDMMCPLLDARSGHCTVYQIRPFICRLWGLVKKMRCPHGCRPKKWVTDKKAHKLMERMDKQCGPVFITLDMEKENAEAPR